MTTATGWTPTRADDQHAWDSMPHTVWDGVPVVDIRLYDVLAQCLQVTGVAAAEHRGKPAIRLDVDNVAAGGKGRIVLTSDQVVSDVKRYDDSAPAPSVAEVLLRRASAQTEAAAGPFDFAAVAQSWAKATGDPEMYEDDEQVLFAFLCDAVEAYSTLLLSADAAERGLVEGFSTATVRRENGNTLQAIAENIVDG